MIIITIQYTVQLFWVFKTEQNKTKQNKSRFGEENTALEKNNCKIGSGRPWGDNSSAIQCF